jgi:hypothetical protein
MRQAMIVLSAVSLIVLAMGVICGVGWIIVIAIDHIG